MTGIKDFNYPAFIEAEKKLMGFGVSPVNNGLGKGRKWSEYMKADIQMLLGCDGILLLPGWQNSRGARLECSIADALGFPSFSTIESAIDWAKSGESK